MRLKWPRARIVAVDPLREHEEAVLRLGLRGVEFHLAALWSEQRALRIYTNYEPDQRASAYELITELPRGEYRDVQAVTLADLYYETRPWGDTLLWLDAEGAELEILRGARGALSETRWINVECRAVPQRMSPPWNLLVEELSERGFRCAGWWNLSRNGRQVDMVFLRAEEWSRLEREKARQGIVKKMERKTGRERRQRARVTERKR